MPTRRSRADRRSRRDRKKSDLDGRTDGGGEQAGASRGREKEYAFVPSEETFTIKRFAEIVRSPLNRNEIGRSRMYQLAMGVAEACASVSGRGDEFTSILFDEIERTVEVLRPHPSVMADVDRAIKEHAPIKFWSYRAGDVPSDIAILAKTACVPVHPNPTHGSIVVMVVRNAAWNWIRSWKRTHKRTIARLFERLLLFERERRRSGVGVNDTGEQTIGTRIYDGTLEVSWKRVLAATPESVCAACGRFGNQTCMGRHCSTVYCGSKCQSRHWPEHRVACKACKVSSESGVDDVV